MTAPGSPQRCDHRSVVLWLRCVSVLVVGMVVAGGATRLAGAGLSITEWRPITGILPPRGAEAWAAAFKSYQVIPQFRVINPHMTLPQFQTIYYWEYAHRLLGRFLALAYLFPFLVFWMQERLRGGLAWRLLAPLFLVGLQGLLGWYMVKSGLSERTSVSHYRLAAHLSLALFLLSYLHWQILKLSTESEKQAASTPPTLVTVFFSVVAVQIVFGAFVAGTKAGYGYPTFPTMAGYWLHPDALRLHPLWVNFFENPAMIQWIHRMLAWVLLLAGIGAWRAAIFERSPRLRRTLVV